MTNESTASDPQPPGRLAALRYRDFRLFWTGLLVSNTGTWMQMTATNWLLYQLTGSAALLGLNGIFRAVPAIGLGVISGTFADRYDRRKLMIRTEVASGLLALALGLLDHSGKIEAWHIYAFTFLNASVGSFDGPARQALFPNLVPRSALANAVALNSLLWKGSALIGPFLAGVAISWMGTAGAFYANAASYFVVVSAISMMRTTSTGSSKGHSLLSETREGFSYIVSRPVVFGIMAMEAVASLFGLNHTMLTIFASDILRVGAHGFGLLQSARGLGAVIGSSDLHRRRSALASWSDSFRFGDSLWRRFCAFRRFAVVRAVAVAYGIGRRQRHDLGRISRHDPADEHTRCASRPRDGSLSIE